MNTDYTVCIFKFHYNGYIYSSRITRKKGGKSQVGRDIISGREAFFLEDLFHDPCNPTKEEFEMVRLTEGEKVESLCRAACHHVKHGCWEGWVDFSYGG